MRIVRWPYQEHRSPEVYYAQREDGSGRGTTMVRLLERLKAHPDEREAWALTNKWELDLQANDRMQQQQYVSFKAETEHSYTIEYLLPERLAPWPNAWVSGRAYSEDEAVSMILKAMDLSGGWQKRETGEADEAATSSDAETRSPIAGVQRRGARRSPRVPSHGRGRSR